ncbi:MAG TPA: SBBP repeat-containing protein, partial [Bryobacteraceae bacterium]|nr:SBBP repeat-containing protein [Bryobacteraceae bacterium]
MLRLYRFALFLGAFSVLVASGRPVGSDSTAAEAKAALARLPLHFEANQGQLGPRVRYSAHARGYDLLLTEHGPSLSFRTPAAPHSQRVEISLLNSNPAPRIEALDRIQARTDFFRGNQANWRTDVPSYSRVRYRAVYPGVDVVYYGNQNQLEYDFVLQPGADPNAIRMKFSGDGHLSLSPDGDLVLESGGARIVQKKPFIYQDDPRTSIRRQVTGRYTLPGHNVVGLRLDRYDRTRTLVVDPSITYLTYLGGPGTDLINAVKLGPKGLLYVAGQTDSNALPGAGYASSVNGLTDVWVCVLDTTNGFGLVYASYLGGTSVDIPLAMDVDSAGIMYLTGTTTSTDFPVTSNAFQKTGAGATVDSFVVKLDPSQSGTDALIYSSYLGGLTGDDTGNGIAVDSNGMIYIIGTTKSTDFPVTASAYAGVIYGTQDTFLCKVDPNAGALAYSTYLGGEGLDWGKAILVGPTGLVYFAASTLSLQFPMAAFNFSDTSFGAQDIIIGVMDMTKSGVDSLVYSTYFGGSGNDDVNSIAFDSKGNLLVTGYTLSSDFPVT